MDWVSAYGPTLPLARESLDLALETAWLTFCS